jgi:hypothetical protein
MMALAARRELRGGARQHSRFDNCGEGGSMSSSLSRFSGWRSRSLSLGEGLPDSTGARDGTRADGVLDRGRRRQFSFCRFAWRRRRATGSIAAGSRGASFRRSLLNFLMKTLPRVASEMALHVCAFAP